MNRRKLFSFLAVSPVAAVSAVAQAKQPETLHTERIVLRNFEIVADDRGLKIRQIGSPEPSSMEFRYIPDVETTGMMGDGENWKVGQPDWIDAQLKLSGGDT